MAGEQRTPEAELRYLARSLKGDITDVAGFVDGLVELAERVDGVRLTTRGASFLSAQLADGSSVDIRLPRARQTLGMVATRAASLTGGDHGVLECDGHAVTADIWNTSERLEVSLRLPE